MIHQALDGKEIIYMNQNNNKRESNAYELLDVLDKPMISGHYHNYNIQNTNVNSYILC